MIKDIFNVVWFTIKSKKTVGFPAGFVTTSILSYFTNLTKFNPFFTTKKAIVIKL
jgi:hypothetical protein